MDMQIIRELQENARKSYRAIAEKLNVSEGTVYNRVSKLKELGVIRGFIPNIDYSKLGFGLVALIGLTVEGGHLHEIEQTIAGESNVSAVYDITGEYDALIVAKFKDHESLNSFVKKLSATEHVHHTYTMLALNVLKEEHGVRI